MKTPRVPLAAEGYPFILFSAFCTLICALLSLWLPTVAGLFLTGFTVWFFRDPVRIVPFENDTVLAPADGRVILVKQITDDRFLHGNVHKVSIFMNVFNVHVNRIPFAGHVEKISFQPGRFFSADSERGALHNEYCAVTIKTGSGRRYTVVQVAGLIARRIVCRLEKDDPVSAGQKYGLIRFGSRVDLYLPLETELKVMKGQKVKAGETVLGLLKA